MSDVLLHTFACMGTVVNIKIVGNTPNAASFTERKEAVSRAENWFRKIEVSCNRFDATSEVRKLSQQPGVPVVVSTILFQAVNFALAVAQHTNGVFDPTIGRHMESLGFTRDYRTGENTASSLPVRASTSFRDVELNEALQTITLHEPLLLDLGAVAKGLAIDMAARELEPLEHYSIDAGGDVLVSGRNPDSGPWAIGIRHPRNAEQLIRTMHVSDVAICTSGDYERFSESSSHHHIVNAATLESANALASVTVLADSAMVADALATAAFSLGPKAGLALLERHNVEGLLVTPSLTQFATARMPLG
ncbi:MAG: FAD:protein FMN transferase [Gemmatimonadaceae bacterium]